MSGEIEKISEGRCLFCAATFLLLTPGSAQDWVIVSFPPVALIGWLLVPPPALLATNIKFSALSGKELLKCPSSFTAKHAASAHFVSSARARLSVVNKHQQYSELQWSTLDTTFSPLCLFQPGQTWQTSVSHLSSGQFVSPRSGSDYVSVSIYHAEHPHAAKASRLPQFCHYLHHCVCFNTLYKEFQMTWNSVNWTLYQMDVSRYQN